MSATVKAHLDEAIRLLTSEAYRVPADDGPLEPMEGICGAAMDLERIDRAIGPKGESIFAAIADVIRSAYVEIKAARAALQEERK